MMFTLTIFLRTLVLTNQPIRNAPASSMRRSILLSVRWAAILVAVFATPHTVRGEAPERDIEFFEKEVRPILVEHCFSCHSAEGRIKGGLRLDTAAGLTTGGDLGPAIVAGQPDASRLMEAVRYKNRDLQMPPKGPLPPTAVKALEQWIRQGAIDPRDVSEMDRDSSGSPTGMSIEKGRSFWAFQPLADPVVPAVKNTERVTNAIDAFILSRLEREGMTFAPEADKPTLIRRVTQNLTGLPPTPREVEAFVNDTSPTAYDDLIERLLNSPQYGVRWGRHWLDVARYADSNGLDENLGYGQAWRYRDYVVDAFNADKPFDRFLIEQIAGDLVPDADRETKTATGFLALGAKVLAEPDRKKLEMDIIDEQLDTMGKAFLGMTFGCVRCHDHKFDPIKQTDYYALAAIFKSTKTLGDTNTGAIKHWYEHSFASENELESLKEVDAQIAEKKSAATRFKNAQIAKIRAQARSQAADYLAEAAKLDVATPLGIVAEIAEPRGLHPRILHHCRMHLEFHQDDALFEPWHRLAANGDIESIRNHYEQLFRDAEEAFAKAKAADPKATAPPEPLLASARAAVMDNAGFLAVPAKEAHAFDGETLAEYYRLMDIARAFESAAADKTAAMGVGEGDVVASLPIHVRGSYKTLGDSVAKEFPEVMRISVARPVFPIVRSGRLELARWMADTRHPLTSRVIVNRIWGWHFGSALVTTTENFGKLGDRPSHPLLLDWLARQFMAGGWSMKDLHRLILKSNAYRQSSTHPEQSVYALRDPQNRWLWKANLQRLEAEQIRDSVLAIADRLDTTIGGKTLPLRDKQFVFNHTSEDHTKYDSVRRAIYLPVIRNNLYAFFQQFDYPDPTMPTGSRYSTIIAPQNLLLMNYDLVMDSAGAMAKSLLNARVEDDQRIAEAYLLAFGREPSEQEGRRSVQFIEKLSGDLANGRITNRTDDPELFAWSLFCQSLMASNEFIYLR